VVFIAYDLLEQRGQDLRDLPQHAAPRAAGGLLAGQALRLSPLVRGRRLAGAGRAARSSRASAGSRA
jgi:hypothetical protein